jgi:hypothetical protein
MTNIYISPKIPNEQVKFTMTNRHYDLLELEEIEKNKNKIELLRQVLKIINLPKKGQIKTLKVVTL